MRGAARGDVGDPHLYLCRDGKIRSVFAVIIVRNRTRYECLFHSLYWFVFLFRAIAVFTIIRDPDVILVRDSEFRSRHFACNKDICVLSMFPTTIGCVSCSHYTGVRVSYMHDYCDTGIW